MQYLQEIDWPKIKRRVVKSLEQNPHPWFMSQRLTRSLCLLQEILPWLSCSASLSVLILLEHTPFLKQLLQLPQFLEKNGSAYQWQKDAEGDKEHTQASCKFLIITATTAFSWCISWCANLTNSSFGIKNSCMAPHVAHTAQSEFNGDWNRSWSLMYMSVLASFKEDCLYLSVSCVMQ